MTPKQARQLQAGDPVWTYKIGSTLSSFISEEMLPTRCFVFGNPAVYRYITRVKRPGDKLPFPVEISKVFFTEEEATAAMRKDIQAALAQYEEDKEHLMDTIRDDLEYDDKQIARLNELLGCIINKETT